MIHSLEELINKINAMHDMAVLAHRKRYEKHDGSYNHAMLKHEIEQIQAMAGEIYYDREGDEIK